MRVLICIILVLSLQACAPRTSDTAADKRAKLAISGALLGGVAGYQLSAANHGLAATGLIGSNDVAGALTTSIASVAGGAIGLKAAQIDLSEKDERIRNAALFFALENNPTALPNEWTAQDKDVKGVITPVGQFQDEHGNVCRDFVEVTDTTQGRLEEEKTACRMPGGYWVAE